MKINKQDISYIENDIYRVLHERSNIAACRCNFKSFQKGKSFIWNVSSQWQIKITD